MKNKDKWIQTIVEIDDNGNLYPNKQSKNGSSYVPITIGCEIKNKIGRKYLKGKLLDLGCGNVPYYAWYKNHVEDNICVDWADTFHKNEYLDIVHDISQDLPFEDGEFDSILSSAVLEHIYNPQHMIKECHRVLKKGGYFTVSSNFSYWEHEAPYDYLRHTQYFFKRVADEVGFKIIEIYPCGDGLCVMADVAAKISMVKSKSILFKLINKFFRFLFNYYHIKRNKVIFPEQPLGYICVMQKER